MPNGPQTLTIERRLTPKQSERRAAARSAARDLAREGGYAAVHMHDVAERSGVARATLYRYFAGKDHLLAEVILDWGREITDDLERDPPAGDTAAQRVANAFTRVVQAAQREPRLTEAVLASSMSSEPEAVRAQARFAEMLAGYIDAAIGDEALEGRAELERVMGHVFFSSVVHLSAGRISRQDAIASLETAARVLFVSAPHVHREART